MMSPHTDLKGGKTLLIDRVFRGVGRIRRASGTTDPAQYRRMVKRFLEIQNHEKGRALLLAMKRRDIKPLELYDRVRAGTLDDLPSADALGPMHDDYVAWVDRKDGGRFVFSPDHRRNLHKDLRRFERVRPGLSVQDLPDVLLTLRRQMSSKARSFNLARAAALGYARFALRRSSPVYLAIQATDPLRQAPKRRAPELPISEVRRYPREAWEMALTGMLPKEYWSRAYSMKGDALHIVGTKREGRNRRIPLIEPIAGPTISLTTFRRQVRAIGQLAVQSKDFRNIYARLLEEAGIPRTRRRLYMGHGRRDITDLYEEREVQAFLAADAVTLRAAVDRLLSTETPTVGIVGRTPRRRVSR